MKNSIYILFFFILLYAGCRKNDDTPEWTKHTGNPVMLPGAATDWDKGFIGIGSVIYYSNKYHMWYSGGLLAKGLLRIGHATSDDGITWTKDFNNPVLDIGPAGSWDDTTAHAPCVMVINNIFHMWYTGHTGENFSYDFQIGHATSPDGTTWTKDPNNPILSKGTKGSWDCSWINAGSVLYDGTKYHIWYTGCDTLVGIKIGHTTSSDGLNWTKDPLNPVLVPGNTGSWDHPRVDFPSVLYDGTTYHMWYSGGNYFAWKIGYATSKDGSKWTKEYSKPVLYPGKAGSWDSWLVANLSVLDNSGKYKMWYWGTMANNTASIGYAEVPHD